MIYPLMSPFACSASLFFADAALELQLMTLRGGQIVPGAEEQHACQGVANVMCVTFLPGADARNERLGTDADAEKGRGEEL
jgi:hypothetical protein